MPRRLLRLAVVNAVFAAAAVLLAAPGASAGTAASQKSVKQQKYTIYLSNNFLGNDWRQQMERVAKVSVQKGPLAGRVDLRVENVETTVQAQINSLNNIIRRKPDAILVDAGSATALNPTLQRACSQGIVVISFDQVVTAPCAYRLQSNWNVIPKVLAQWVVSVLHGQGKVFVDRGLAGAPISAQIYDGYLSVLKRFPGIKVIGQFNGNYAFGPEQQGVASLLAAHPDVDAILTQGYGAAALKALQQAGHKLVPVTGFSYNVSATTCAQTPGAKCILGSNAPYLSSEAIKLAVGILDGKKPNKPGTVFLYTPYFTTNLVSVKGPGIPSVVALQKLRVGKNAFPKLPPGLTTPITPSWVNITPQEAAGK